MNIVRIERMKNVITHVVDTGRTEPERFKYSAIKCGIAWPGGSWPGFYVILGEELPCYIDRFDGIRKNIRIFAEHQYDGFDLEEFFDKITDGLVRFGCENIYANISGKNESFKEDFYEYQDTKKLRNLSLIKAPWVDNWILGVGLIEEKFADKTLTFKNDSIILEQLRRIQKQNLEEEPHKRFWAIEALRHPLADLKKHPTNSPKPSESQFENFLPNSESAWMAH